MKITIEAVPFIEVRLNKRETVELIEVLRHGGVKESGSPDNPFPDVLLHRLLQFVTES